MNKLLNHHSPTTFFLESGIPHPSQPTRQTPYQAGNVSSPDSGAQPQWELSHCLQRCQKLPPWGLLGFKILKSGMSKRWEMQRNNGDWMGRTLLATFKTLAFTQRWSQGRINSIILMKNTEAARDEQGEEGPK